MNRVGVALWVATVLCAPAAWAGPDLVITDITIDPASPKVGEGKIRATVLNQGDEGTGVFVNINLVMYLDGVECDTGLIVAGLGEGNTATEDTTSCNASTPGPHLVRFEVDTEGDVDEDDETNNALEVVLTWSGPDLIVQSIALDPAMPEVGEGELTFVFANVGPWDVDTPTTDKTNYTVAIDGVVCAESFIFDLNAGDTNTESTNDCGALSPGPHEVTVTIDSNGEVVETDETNNSLTQTFEWAGGADLVITGITLDPTLPKVGDGTLQATIANVGTSGTGTFVNINLRMFLDGEECDTGLIVAGLGAGNEATENTSSCNPEQPGEHVIRFEVDTDDDVLESDESNNSFEQTFTWTAPDLVITGVEGTADPFDPGADNTFTATVLNDSTVGTGTFVNINLRMTLNGEECDTGLIIAGLGAGKTATEETTSCNPDAPGVHVLGFEVDTDQDVVETNEQNNLFVHTFVVCGGPEQCNGFDDDCDGQTDEGFELGSPCDGDDPDECANGQTVCGLDGEITCEESGEPQAEVCDADDNDCDGLVDEDFPTLGQTCVPESGCGAGLWVCDADGGVTCQPGVPETCNGLDDDCDGTTDEDFPALGAPCVAGVGACRATGVVTCAGPGVACDASPSAPQAEACNDGQDNDCDGLVDEGCACEPGEYRVCGTDVGACSPGIQPCVDSVFAASCEDAVLPTPEVCGNSADENCDGTPDDGCLCTSGQSRPCPLSPGACQGGTQWCVAGQWGQCASATAPADEQCNGLDDDCDGTTDEGCPCDGAPADCTPTPDDCADYARTCIPGQPWSPCAPVPGTEVPDCPGEATTDGGDAAGDGGGATTGTGDTGGTGFDTGTGGSDTGGDDTTGTTGLSGGDPETGGSGPGPVVPASSDGGCTSAPSSAAPTLFLPLLLLLAAVLTRRLRASD